MCCSATWSNASAGASAFPQAAAAQRLKDQLLNDKQILERQLAELSAREKVHQEAPGKENKQPPAAEATNSAEKDKDTKGCSICLDAARDTVFFPCGYVLPFLLIDIRFQDGNLVTLCLFAHTCALLLILAQLPLIEFLSVDTWYRAKPVPLNCTKLATAVPSVARVSSMCCVFIRVNCCHSDFPSVACFIDALHYTARLTCPHLTLRLKRMLSLSLCSIHPSVPVFALVNGT